MINNSETTNRSSDWKTCRNKLNWYLSHVDHRKPQYLKGCTWRNSPVEPDHTQQTQVLGDHLEEMSLNSEVFCLLSSCFRFFAPIRGCPNWPTRFSPTAKYNGFKEYGKILRMVKPKWPHVQLLMKMDYTHTTQTAPWTVNQGAFVLFLKCITVAQKYVSYDSAFVQGCSANYQCFGGNLIYTSFVVCMPNKTVISSEWFGCFRPVVPTFVAWQPGRGDRANGLCE